MPAPKNNKFAIGNSGRAKKWESVEALQSDIDEYFNWCIENPIKQIHNSQIDADTKKPLIYDIDRPYTIEGLCDFLDCDRLTLINYQKQEGYEEFFNTIKRAKNKIQQNKVERGLVGNAPASVTIFDLKNNHGYKDKSETDITTNGKELKSSLILPEGQTMETLKDEIGKLVNKK